MVMCAENQNQQLIDLFSSFITFVGETTTQWRKDIPLANNIKKVLNANPRESSTEFWVNYWCEQRGRDLDNRFPEKHLQAYLQKACLKAAQIRCKRIHQNNSITLRDYFQTAFFATEAIIKKYSYERNPNLQAHGINVYLQKLRDYERAVGINANASSWYLLLRTTETQTAKALTLAGFSEQNIDCIFLAIDCFREFYSPEENTINRTFQEPSLQTWNQILAAYNSQALGLNISQANLQKIQTWLATCTQAIRKLNQKKEISLDQPITNQEESEFTLLDTIPSNETKPLEYAAIQQLKEILQDVINCFAHNSQTLNSENKRKKYREILQILSLYYGKGLDQKTVAIEVYGDISFQSTVSRRLKDAKKESLKRYLQIINPQLHKQNNSDDINNIIPIIEECLINYYAEQFTQGSEP